MSMEKNHRESYEKIEWGVQKPGKNPGTRHYGEDGKTARENCAAALPGHKLVRRLVEVVVYEWEEVPL